MFNIPYYGIINSKKQEILRPIKMCDVVKYTKIYNEIKNLEPEDTLQLILESEDADERNVY